MVNGLSIKLFLCITCACFLSALHAVAQPCPDDYFINTYASSKVISLQRSIVTSNKEMVCVGTIDRSIPSAFLGDGWLAKFSDRGTPLWSKRFQVPNCNFVVLRSVVEGPDDTYYAVGEGVDSLGTGSFSGIIGVFLQVDRYGNILQSRVYNDFDVQREQAHFFNIMRASDGDLLITGIKSKLWDVRTQSFIMRISPEGKIRWTAWIGSPSYSYGFGTTNAITQTKSGNIVAALLTDERTGPNFTITKIGYQFFQLDYQTGKKVWEKTYIYADMPLSFALLLGYTAFIKELADGRLSFHASFTDKPLMSPPHMRRTVQMITNAGGVLQKVHSYSSTSEGLKIADAYELEDGGSLMLEDDGQNSLLVRTDAEGAVQSSKAFGPTSGQPVPISVLPAPDNSSYMWMGDADGMNIHLYKTDKSGNMGCAPVNLPVNTEDGMHYFKTYQTDHTFNSFAATNSLEVKAFGVIDHPLTSNTVCKATCCSNSTDTLSMELCDQDAYTLPNQYTVKKAGTYYVNYKVRGDCDSVMFYKISFPKKPAVSLGRDACLEGKDSLVLRAAGGYDNYTWNNVPGTDSSLTVRQPGTYRLRVSNACGNTESSIVVHEKCLFNIYMPNAFSPNNDRVNDLFRVPAANQNKLVRLSVYNRWGQLVFSTSDVNAGWDGKFKGQLQPEGAYAYVLVMETLDGKTINHSGTVMLMR